MSQVAAAMSGGVDSSVAAALALQDGSAVFGVTMRLFSRGSLPVAGARRGRCCGGEDTEEARGAAHRLGIPFYVLDLEEEFRAAVIDDLVASYRAGSTPLPCARCNDRIKFSELLDRVRALGARRMVTGHYARKGRSADGRLTLARAADRDKDQTYFLFGLTQEMLDGVEFPLGALQKSEVRQIARRHALANAEKPESQDLCFVPDGDYRSLVQRLAGAEAPGEMTDSEGRVLGRHDGLSGFTIGQRRRLGLGGGERRYVVAMEPETRRVTVGGRDELLSRSALTGPVNWVSRVPGAAPVEVEAQVRHRQPPVPAMLARTADGGAQLRFCRPVAAVAPGQAAVFYEGDVLLGGAWIRQGEAG